jgi:transposase-like protein
MTIDFKGSQYPKTVILYAVFFYVRYAVSYRDLEEIMAERGVDVDHANREPVGGKVLSIDRKKSAQTEAENSFVLAHG